MIRKHYAIIDMGSNSFRLVINEIDNNGRYQELYNFKTVARLSTFINDDGVLQEAGISLILETLQRFKEVLDYHQIDDVTIIATAAMRKAQNQKDIAKLVQDRLGLSIRILSEYEEAFYGYLAVINSTSIQNGITIDIGGGSTEVTLFTDRELKHFHSFPFGAITLQQQFFSEGQAPAAISELKKYINQQLQTLSWLKGREDYPIIGIGGSARNLALIHQRQSDYPLAGIHQYEMGNEDLSTINTMLQQSTIEQRLLLDGLSKDRVEIIIPAAEVISSLVSYVEANTFIMSRKGLRDGVFYEALLEKMDTKRFPNVVEESIHQITNSYHVQIDHANHISTLALQLYKQLAPYAQVSHDEQEALKLLNYSARVLYIGESISSEASSQNTFYLLTNMTIEGLSHKERLAVAFISSFKSKSLMMHYAEPFKQLIQKKELKLFEFLGSIMKLAYSLDRTRRKVISKVGEVTQLSGEILIPLYYKEDPFFENIQASKSKKQIEKAIKQTIEFQYMPSK
ncbi:exopolyphosphatase [Halalkalibacter akibai]|uniref:Exopolyphosphatase n=1 Tax=Halalkalibacter akibai (strain ATCC 43226 / DSM 21942 / CIP 109018 / JCM 9157 / 1139) TaxID=1236973 RepID=W4QNH2_HALA3|nr:exopolyphosphatase [Halalkalibacter akibai]GAE33427.1 exopolyphosphatase [Halalkalibacter akibai JCM 9157]